MELEKEMLFLSEDDTKECITIEEAVKLAEKGVIADANGKVVGNKYYMDIGGYGYIKPFSGYIEGEEQAFVKTFSMVPENPARRGLPASKSLVILFDVDTLLPVCFMEASWITGVKTAASTAITAKYLAKKGSRIATIFGAGLQGRTHLEALSQIFSLGEVRIVDVVEEAVQSYIRDMSKKLGLKIIAATGQQAVSGADIVITVTTGNEPMVYKEWLSPGALVLKLGSFQELDLGLVVSADKLVVDRWKWTSDRVPELKTLIREGRLSKDNLHAEWLDIVGGRKSGRESADEVIVYIALGIMGEYAAILPCVYRRALELKIGQKMRLSLV